MRHIPYLLNALWLIASLGYVAVAVSIGLRRKLGQWPSLFAYCVVYAAGSALLESQIHHYSRYFWIFWDREIILALIRILVLVDIFRAVPAVRFIPRPLYVGTAIASAAAAYISWAVSAYGVHPVGKMALGLLINQCATVSWGAALVVILGGIALSGFGLHLESMRIATGYICTILTAMFSASVYSSNATQFQKLLTNELSGVFEIGVLVYWLYSLHKSDDSPEIPVANDDGMNVLPELYPTYPNHCLLEKVGSL